MADMLAHIGGGGPVRPQWVAGAGGLVGLIGALEARSQASDHQVIEVNRGVAAVHDGRRSVGCFVA